MHVASIVYYYQTTIVPCCYFFSCVYKCTNRVRYVALLLLLLLAVALELQYNIRRSCDSVPHWGGGNLRFARYT